MELKNGEIWKAYPQLAELSKIKLPVKCSLGVATLANKLSQPYTVIEGERVKLVRKYGKEDETTKQLSISVEDENWMAFIKDLEELLDTQWGEEIKFEKIILPEKIAGTCDKCNHNMDVVFQIEPETLMPLVGKFVEVK